MRLRVARNVRGFNTNTSKMMLHEMRESQEFMQNKKKVRRDCALRECVRIQYKQEYNDSARMRKVREKRGCKMMTAPLTF